MGIALWIIALCVVAAVSIAITIVIREVLPRAADRTGYLAEQIPYRQLIGERLMLLDKGRLLTVWEIRGKDFSSLTYRQQAALAANAATAFADVDEAVEVRFRTRRITVTGFPQPPTRPRDPVAATLYDFQSRQYNKPNLQFVSHPYLVLSWSPPPKVLELLSRTTNAVDDDSFEATIRDYETKVDEFADALDDSLKPRRLSANELLRFLHRCATFEDHPIDVPETEIVDGLFVRPFDTTGIIVDQDILPDFIPRIGNKWVEVIAVETLRRGGTTPGALDRILQLKMDLDVDVRCIKLSPEQVAEAARSAWNKQRGKSDQRAGQMRNLPAEKRASKAQEIDPDNTKLFHWNIKVILANENRKRVIRAARFVKGQLQRAGFGARIERLGNPDALIAALPGKVDTDLTESLIDELTVADLAPLNHVYGGPVENPHPRRKGLPPTLHGLGLGNTPVDIYDTKDDVAHMGYMGPIGSGKSTQLAMMVASDRMLTDDVDDIIFDQGRSAERVTVVHGGDFFRGDPGSPTGGINPYAGIEDPRRRARVALWHHPFFEARGVEMNEQRTETLNECLNMLAKSKTRSATLAASYFETYDRSMAKAFSHLTLKGPAGHLFDSEREDQDFSAGLQCFEMGTILRYRDNLITSQFILLVFDRVLEESERTGRHLRISLDEAHTYFKHPVFAPLLGNYYDQARKLDGGIRMFTQRMQQFLESSIAQTVLDCTAQWGFFATPSLAEGDQRELFKSKFPGITDEICNQIANVAKPKRHVVMWDGEHASLVNLRIADEVLTMVGASSKDDIAELNDVRAQVPKELVAAELWRRRGQHEAADRYLAHARDYGILSTEAA